MKRFEVTIHDIAKELGIAASTVSRALQGSSLISEATSKRVKDKAMEMGYRPNSVASNLRNSKTNTIGIIVSRINRHFFSAAISGIQDEASKYGYNVIISQSNEKVEAEKQEVANMYTNRVDGLIVSSTMYTDDFSHFNIFKEKHIPLVFFDRIPDSDDFQQVAGEDQKGAYLATEHLLQQGFSRIAHFSGPLTTNIYRDRLAGYKAALVDYGIPYREEYVIFHELTRESSIQATEQLLALSELPDALFSANDIAALTAMQIMKEKGMTLPDDMAVIGYSNEPSAIFISPALSTVDQSAYAMGVQAAIHLIEQLNQAEFPYSYQRTVLPVTLIVRESSLKK